MIPVSEEIEKRLNTGGIAHSGDGKSRPEEQSSHQGDESWPHWPLPRVENPNGL